MSKCVWAGWRVGCEEEEEDMAQMTVAAAASADVDPKNPLQCHVCMVRCGSANDLRRHVMTHTGEKPFTCQFCNHRTARKYNLKKHMRDVHGIPPEYLWPSSTGATSTPLTG